MLRLKRVELQGFKSFCDRTELRFHGEGIAAIVGPNGCGKSNISDAISWVLGEQSAKSLRGSRMEDVIFAGTRDRKALGMAYVTMTLVDPEVHAESHAHKLQAVEEGQAPRMGEVTITRRLYRSGESEYLIDGHIARLRDIQDLFMGTGLGPESYAIIEQGRIGQILSSKPQDRRGVIEEAAGLRNPVHAGCPSRHQEPAQECQERARQGVEDKTGPQSSKLFRSAKGAPDWVAQLPRRPLPGSV